MDAVQKKNIAMMNVAPGSYDRGLKDKKDMPKYRWVTYYWLKLIHGILYSMGAKLTEIDKRVSPGAGTYNIPSKAIEK